LSFGNSISHEAQCPSLSTNCAAVLSEVSTCGAESEGFGAISGLGFSVGGVGCSSGLGCGFTSGFGWSSLSCGFCAGFEDGAGAGEGSGVASGPATLAEVERFPSAPHSRVPLTRPRRTLHYSMDMAMNMRVRLSCGHRGDHSKCSNVSYPHGRLRFILGSSGVNRLRTQCVSASRAQVHSVTDLFTLHE
jgi:hypothetical protein